MENWGKIFHGKRRKQVGTTVSGWVNWGKICTSAQVKPGKQKKNTQRGAGCGDQDPAADPQGDQLTGTAMAVVTVRIRSS